MSFLKTWSPHFKSNVRMRGRAIQNESRVKMIAAEDGELARAQVQGRQVYAVTVCDSGDGQSADLACTCQHFLGGVYCKHLWAALLELKYGEHDVPNLPALLERACPRPPKARRRTGSDRPVRVGEPRWMGRLTLLQVASATSIDAVPSALPQSVHVSYVIDPESSTRYGELVVQLIQRRSPTDSWRQAQELKISAATVGQLHDEVDRRLCALILGGTWAGDPEATNRYEDERARSAFRIRNGAWRSMLRQLIDTRRCFIDMRDETVKPLRWDPDSATVAPWRLWLAGELEEQGLKATVELRRGDRRLAIDRPQLILCGRDGLIICNGLAEPFDDGDAARWVSQFRGDLRFSRDTSAITVGSSEVGSFLDRLYALAQLPEIDLPAEIARQAEDIAPIGRIEILSPVAAADAVAGPQTTDRTSKPTINYTNLSARVSFEYGSHHVRPGQSGRFITASTATSPQPDEASDSQDGELEPNSAKVLIRRDRHWERAAMLQLATLGFRQQQGNGANMYVLPAKRMLVIVEALLTSGWSVTVDQQVVRQPGQTRFSVVSGIDWFELRGNIRFETDQGDYAVPLPEILAAARRGQRLLTLDDGTRGLLPEKWLDEHGLLTSIGELQDDHLRFKTSQSALLDALLNEQELIDVDQRFEQARQRLHQFERIESIEPQPTFVGTLRPYQKHAMGWFAFLRWFGIGGILADDMGLGKTVQVLAMLDAWYGKGNAPEDERPHRPTLIVVPRSVVFNWIDEAQRFAPKLRIQEYTGTERSLLRDAFKDHDVVVTTYGLMRRDIEDLLEHRFDYVVLDEAQMIKNPGSQSAKAARLLRADHRLALTGTPIENHLGDLWSIFEYLNPGMLGSNTRFAKLVRNTAQSPRTVPPNEAPADDAEPELSLAAQSSIQVAQALKPFILRRTKQKVLKDLPAKTEQTILCEMQGEQRKIYEELRRHYRGTLLQRRNGTAEEARGLAGIGSGSTMMVLEALLRLRQAACHPGLIDPSRSQQHSAKLEALLDALTELIDEGHKALVFSQFTSMLGLVRKRLDQEDISYTYLDGRTTNRREIVHQFQTDPKCSVFLISLKAGGLGLNLTAAEYVFILDPWWNPAVEQQAIDRTHRIGQTRRVIAYRMICQDTIEQHIVELQAQKRKLADAIVGGDTSMLSGLTRADLEHLLS